MRRNDLCYELRKEYHDDSKCGVARVNDPHHNNMWFVVPPSPPAEFVPKKAIKALAKANRVINQLPSFTQMTSLDHVLSYLFVRREALISSRIEGTWSTIDEVLTAEPPSSAGEKTGTASIKSYAEALEKHFQTVVTKGYAAMDMALVCDLHRMIVSKDPTYYNIAGKLRAPGEPGSIVYIGGHGQKENSLYNPAPPQYVKQCLNQVMSWYSDSFIAEKGDAGLGMPLAVRLAIGHVHFEAVHPFTDGNGRVGRMLWPLQMILSDVMPLYLSGYIEAEKDAYADTLNFAQLKLNYIPFIEFICEAFDASYREMQATKAVLLELPEQWQQKLEARQNSTAARTIPLLINTPIITARQLEKLLDTSFQSASTALKQLVQAKILRERTGQQRDRVYAAEEVIYTLSRPFAQDPTIALSAARRCLSKES